MSRWGSAAVRIGAGVAWTVGESRVVAMDLSQPGAIPLVLEGTAAVVWDEIAAEDGLETEELLRRLSAEFRIDVDVIRPDVESLLTGLAEQRLLEH